MRVDLKIQNENPHVDFDQLLVRMRTEVRRYAGNRLDASHADEVIADVFIAAHAANERGVNIAPGWIMRVARNKVIDRWRRVSRQSRLEERLAFERSNNLSHPTLRFQQDILSGEVAETLSLLPPRYGRLLRQHYLEGIPIAQIADSAGATYTATESAMARARQAFRCNHNAGA